MGETIARMSEGTLVNTISKCETAPYSNYCFKKSIEGITSLPNTPSNFLDNQRQNLPPPITIIDDIDNKEVMDTETTNVEHHP